MLCTACISVHGRCCTLTVSVQNTATDVVLSGSMPGYCLGHGYCVYDLRAHVQALLQMESVKDTEFEPEVLACLPATPWSISGAEVSMRKDLRRSRCSLSGPACKSGPCIPTLCECMALAF